MAGSSGGWSIPPETVQGPYSSFVSELFDSEILALVVSSVCAGFTTHDPDV